MDAKKHIVITISRDFGAEGHEIGMILQKRLQIKLYDKDILEQAAIRKGVAVSAISAADENTGKSFFSSFPIITAGFKPEEDRLFEVEEQIIHDVASNESCIIVGRLSDYLLRNEPFCIKVLIYAPLQFRVENIMNKRNMTENEARKYVKQMDAKRKKYCEFYSNGKWNQQEGKDICLNRATFSVEACADILEAMIRTQTEER